VSRFGGSGAMKKFSMPENGRKARAEMENENL